MKDWSKSKPQGNWAEFISSYWVSDDGRIWSDISGRLLRIQSNGNGYYIIRINNTNYLIHRLVALHFAFNSNPQEYNVVDHVDGIRTNNHHTNLRWCNTKMNTENSMERKTHSCQNTKEMLNNQLPDKPRFNRRKTKSGLRGISIGYSTKRGCNSYRVSVSIGNGKSKMSPTFYSLEEALKYQREEFFNRYGCYPDYLIYED